MSKEKTTTIKKDSLWKYGVLVLAVILLAVLLFHGNDAKPTTDQSSGLDLLKAIEDNPDIFPSIGPSDAKITVTEFSDFQCPYCGLASGLVPWGDQYKTRYSDLYGSAGKVMELAKEGKIRFVAGIMSFLGQESIYAAEAAYCADEQDMFFDMFDAIYSAQTEGENTGKYNKEELKVIAQGVEGLDQDSFNDCLDNDRTLDLVKKSSSITSKFATGTPMFYVNNKKVASSWSVIESEIGA